jgi:hypothetical protein
MRVDMHILEHSYRAMTVRHRLAGVMIITSLAMSIPLSAWAQTITATTTSSSQRDSTLTGTTISNGTVLTPNQADALARDQARVWSISVEEYKKYEQLMRGMRGRLSSPNITPYEVLGIHADNPGEQMKWARRFAQAIAEDTQRIIAFEVIYLEAFKQLYPGMTPFKEGTPFMTGGDLAPKSTQRSSAPASAPAFAPRGRTQ